MDKRKLLEVDEDILFCAFRYALGRKTYIVSVLTDEIHKQWHLLSDKTKSMIQKEIKVAIETDNAGWDCDKELWETILTLNI